MVGFNYKSLVLQIIHGSVLLGTAIIVFFESCSIDEYFKNDSSTIIIFSIFLIASFVIGVVIDFLADWIETALFHKKLNPPVYFMLQNGVEWKIVLAHNGYILQQLCKIASKHYVGGEKNFYKHKWLREQFKVKNKKVVNYILQVAKNRAFRKCKLVQKDQIDSFFMLYVFSRNIALSLLFSSSILIGNVVLNKTCEHIVYSILMIAVSIVFFCASYRYYLYYLRILLGSSFKIKCLTKDEE